MSTVKFDYQRKFTDTKVQRVIQRGTATVNVLEQLGTEYQSLPGHNMADLQTETNALEAKFNEYLGLVGQLEQAARDMDAMSEPLDDKNKGALSMLQGMLNTADQKALLKQIPR